MPAKSKSYDRYLRPNLFHRPEQDGHEESTRFPPHELEAGRGSSRPAQLRTRGRGLKTTATYPKTNARLFTWLPRGGDHVRRAERIARMLRRKGLRALFTRR